MPRRRCLVFAFKRARHRAEADLHGPRRNAFNDGATLRIERSLTLRTISELRKVLGARKAFVVVIAVIKH
ncbi:hypothetical protein CBM2621_B110115 [Cupriavidus taiwanensis]|nr:hypothetical protein CBM2621_B110115 [Cupriavidus taiwanensis]